MAGKCAASRRTSVGWLAQIADHSSVDRFNRQRISVRSDAFPVLCGCVLLMAGPDSQEVRGDRWGEWAVVTPLSKKSQDLHRRGGSQQLHKMMITQIRSCLHCRVLLLCLGLGSMSETFSSRVFRVIRFNHRFAHKSFDSPRLNTQYC